MKKSPETILPYQSNEPKSKQIECMFDSIAPTYDLLNRLMSFGQDIRWRRKVLEKLRALAPSSLLDVATGTADLAIDASRWLHVPEVIGIDLSADMLHIGKEKVTRQKLDTAISLRPMDALQLSFPDQRFDAVTVAFGVRNFKHIDEGIKEMYRVLRPGGRLVILELSRPTNPLIHFLFQYYSNKVIPWMGKRLSHNKAAYTYLPATIQVVPQGEEMLAIMQQAGFQHTCFQPLTFGTCTLYWGDK
jgi:demethylmenaquinone methyltransferase/2-methoxy-6-polyprenyl-1,4-benzoquinol methylase